MARKYWSDDELYRKEKVEATLTSGATVTPVMLSLPTGTNPIGSATVTVGAELPAGAQYVGLATVDVGTIPEVNALATVTQSGALPAGTNYVGLATVDIGSQPESNLASGDNYIGLATVDIGKALPAGTNTIGNVKIAGSNSTPTTAPISIFASGNATVFVAANTFKILSLKMVFDEDEDIKLLSGTDYLCGSTSIAMSFAAEGGFTEQGSVDAPVYIASGGAKGFVINSSATGDIAGHVTWIDE